MDFFCFPRSQWPTEELLLLLPPSHCDGRKLQQSGRRSRSATINAVTTTFTVAPSAFAFADVSVAVLCYVAIKRYLVAADRHVGLAVCSMAVFSASFFQEGRYCSRTELNDLNEYDYLWVC